MKNFSIFDRAAQVLHCTPIEDLGHISNLSRRLFASHESFQFRTSAPSLEYAALMIEHEVLLRTDRGGRIYAGFEKLSNLEPIVERYQRIADVSESVTIFGQPDWNPPRHPHIRYIDVNSDFNLAHEWFLIAESSILNIALIALADQSVHSSNPEGRVFSTIKTSNPKTVSRLSLAIEGVIDWAMVRAGH